MFLQCKVVEGEQKIYHSMSGPQWFQDLGYEEKIRIAKKMASIPENPRFLTDEEISNLMPSSRQ